MKNTNGTENIYKNRAVQQIQESMHRTQEDDDHGLIRPGRSPGSGLHVVLVEPEIPANTGNISRTCALTGTKLHLVKPLGFSIEDRMLKRAGLDYWDHLDIEVHENLDDFLKKYGTHRLFLATTHGSVRYTDVSYQDGDFLLFGKETAGLPKSLIARHPDTAVRVPMGNDPSLRSLNLSNSVAVVLYEALRQTGFPGLV